MTMFRNVLVTLALLGLFFGPTVTVVSVAALASPATTACTPGSLTVGPIPESLTATTKNGETITLNRAQLTHAATIITVGGQTAGVGRPGALIALMAALTESSLRMLANTGSYPESGDYPNDGNGSDHDSLGLFQMRPAAGWGTVHDLMNPTYQAHAFYGGPSGPNYPSPRGLLDIPNWQQLDPGAAAQAVEVSAYPDRYQNFQPVAETILTTLTSPTTGTGNTGNTDVPETTRVVFPLPDGSWVKTGGFGGRADPFTFEPDYHFGTDYGAADGTPIFTVADGIVVYAGYTGTWGGLIIIEHKVHGERVASYYAHMWEHGIHVTDGMTVTAGQHIGDVGSSGKSTGAHLHLEIRPGGQGQPAIDSDKWLQDQGAEGLTDGETSRASCTLGGHK